VSLEALADGCRRVVARGAVQEADLALVADVLRHPGADHLAVVLEVEGDGGVVLALGHTGEDADHLDAGVVGLLDAGRGARGVEGVVGDDVGLGRDDPLAGVQPRRCLRRPALRDLDGPELRGVVFRAGVDVVDRLVGEIGKDQAEAQLRRRVPAAAGVVRLPVATCENEQGHQDEHQPAHRPSPGLCRL
jgi:hypothetical protein